jgi:hypothetical protein
MKMLLAVAGTLLFATATIAEDDIWKFTINNETNAKWSVNPDKPKPKKVPAPGVPGEFAMRVKATPGSNPWDQQANTPSGGNIKAGDVVMVMYYARAEQAAPEGSTLPTLVQLKSAPYTSIMNASHKITSEWAQYCAFATASIDLPKGAGQVSLHLATAEQVVDIGPVFVFNFGPGYDTKSLTGCKAV